MIDFVFLSIRLTGDLSRQLPFNLLATKNSYFGVIYKISMFESF